MNSACQVSLFSTISLSLKCLEDPKGLTNWVVCKGKSLASSQRTPTNLGMSLSGWSWSLSQLVGQPGYSGPLLHQGWKGVYAEKVGEHTDDLLATHPHQIYQVGGDVIRTWPTARPEDRVGQARMRYYITCLSEGMKSYVAMPVNCDKVWGRLHRKMIKTGSLPEPGDWGIPERTLVQTLNPQKGGHTGHVCYHPGYSLISERKLQNLESGPKPHCQPW